ncbi:MAG: hypothetical protein JNL95_03915 [Chitinophagales bacterium]|nr:hypothetical protein [Chitinophagales bacterium]
MRYVPNLIPPKSKVLKDYFKGDVYQSSEQNKLHLFLGWFFGFVFLFAAFALLKHPLVSVLLALLAFVLLPPIHSWIEKTLRFRLTAKMQSIAGAILFVGTIPLQGHYNRIDKIEEVQLRLLHEKDEKIKVENEQKDQIRKDSLAYYIQCGSDLTQLHKTDEAIKKLDHALLFANHSTEIEQVEAKRTEISVLKTDDLIQIGKYQSALQELEKLALSSGNNSDILYKRAICLSRTGRIQDAINDCKSAIQLGSGDAEKLYNQINPIQRRVSFYITRCCDGSSSNAKGRGACSHHGGVCDWNEPVYEEYRKYE